MNNRRLKRLLDEGILAFLGAYFMPWNWSMFAEEPKIDTVEALWLALRDAVAAQTELATEEVDLKLGILLETLNSGEPFSNLDGLVSSANKICLEFEWEGMEDLSDQESMKMVCTAAISVLLTDEGRLTGGFSLDDWLDTQSQDTEQACR